jgi:excinuclease ABC subunit A
MFQGPPQHLLANPDQSLTGQYLAGLRRVEVPATRRSVQRGEVVVRGARANNLKNVDVAFPLGMFIAVDWRQRLGQVHAGQRNPLSRAGPHAVSRGDEPGLHTAIEGIELVDKVIQIDQSPDWPDAAVESGHRTPACSRLSASCLPCCRRRAHAGYRAGASLST